MIAKWDCYENRNEYWIFDYVLIQSNERAGPQRLGLVLVLVFFHKIITCFFLRDHFLYRSLEHINGVVKKQSNHILWTGFGSVSLRIFWSTSSIRDRKAIFDWAIFPRDGFEILISGQENVIVFLHRFVIIDLYGKWLIMWIINRENNKSKSFCFYYK